MIMNEKKSDAGLDPQLARLFMLNRIGNTKMLEESLKTSLAFLDHNKITPEKLLDCEDFRHILVKGLSATSGKNSVIQVQMHSACLLQRLMERVNKSQAGVLVGTGVIPLLVRLLLSQQKAICVQTLVALNSTAEHGFRVELHKADVIPSLSQLTNRYPTCPVILQLITLHVSYLCMTSFEVNRRQEGPLRSPFMAIHAEDQATFKANLPSTSFMKQVIPLLSRLMESNATLNLEKIHGLTTAVVSKIGIVEDTLQALADSRILQRIVALLCYPQEFVSAGAVTAIGCIAKVADNLDSTNGSRNPTLEFLQCLAKQGNDGLKYLHRFLKSDRIEICTVTFQFIAKIVQMIEEPESEEESRENVIDAIFQTGLIHVLLHCLKLEKSCIPKDFRFNVIWAVRIIMRRVNPFQKQFLMESGIVPLLVNMIVESSSSEEDADAFNCSAAVDCLLFLVTTVEKLVDCSDFLRVVVKGLQPTTMSAPIQMHAASLLQHLMARATSLQAETMVGAGIIPLLVNLLPSKNKAVLVQTLMALNNIAKHGFHQELHSAGVIQALIHLSAKEASCPVIMQGIALIVYNMYSFPAHPQTSAGSPLTLSDSKHEDILRMVIPLVAKVIDANTFHNVKEIHALITSILCKLGKLGATLQWLADADVLKKLVAKLNHPQEFVRFCAAKAIECMGRADEEDGKISSETSNLECLEIKELASQ